MLYRIYLEETGGLSVSLASFCAAILRR